MSRTLSGRFDASLAAELATPSGKIVRATAVALSGQLR